MEEETPSIQVASYTVKLTVAVAYDTKTAATKILELKLAAFCQALDQHNAEIMKNDYEVKKL